MRGRRVWLADDPASDSISGGHYRLFVRLAMADLSAVFAVTKRPGDKTCGPTATIHENSQQQAFCAHQGVPIYCRNVGPDLGALGGFEIGAALSVTCESGPDLTYDRAPCSVGCHHAGASVIAITTLQTRFL